MVPTEKEPEELSIRPFRSELNVLNRPDGSAMISQGQTVVLVAVNGPLESKQQKVQFDRANFDVVYRSKTGYPSSEEKAFQSIIKNACESALFPMSYARCDITLFVQEMQNRGSIVSCAINAGCLALINAGLELQHLVAAVTCMMDSNKEIVVDPSTSDLERAQVVMVIAFSSTCRDIVALDLKGRCSSENYSKMVEACMEASKSIFGYYKSTVKKYCQYACIKADEDS